MESGVPLNTNRLVWKIIDWFYPPSCVECGCKGYNICPKCLSEAVPINDSFCNICGKPVNILNGCSFCQNYKFHFTSARAAFVYEGAIRTAIKKLKYAQDLGLSELFSNFLFSIYLKEKWDVNLVTAVPLYKNRFSSRGFNQSEWIARPLSKAIGIPFSSGALQKTIHTNPQVGLNQNERRINLQKAFQAEPAIVVKKKILLIDDVMTTGSTFDECANTLLKAGASEVYCLSVASTVIL
ncbi:MAG: ComF family protein [Flexilinea sp.]